MRACYGNASQDSLAGVRKSDLGEDMKTLLRNRHGYAIGKRVAGLMTNRRLRHEWYKVFGEDFSSQKRCSRAEKADGCHGVRWVVKTCLRLLPPSTKLEDREELE